MKNNSQSPSFRYPGGKAKQSLTICSYAPQAGGTFADVFCGLGNVFWAATSSLCFQSWWLNDIRTCGFFHAIARVGNTVKVPDRSTTKMFYDYYKNECFAEYGDSHRDEATVLAPYLTRNGGGYAACGASRIGGGPGAIAYARSLCGAHRIMHRINPRVTDWDYEKVFEHLGPNDFAFIDPPYLGANVGTYSAVI